MYVESFSVQNVSTKVNSAYLTVAFRQSHYHTHLVLQGTAMKWKRQDSKRILIQVLSS